MNLVDLNSVLISYLRENMPNPHGTGNWIYVDYPRLDATFPRISLTQTGGELSPIAIGEFVITDSPKYGKLATIMLDIDVWVKINDRATFNSETYVGTKLRDYLASKVIEVLEKGKETLKEEHGIIDIEIVGITTLPLDEENQLHRKTITIRVSFIWER